jgi:hypothetical protein
MSSLNTHGGAWTNRSGMWPLSEKRLVFTSKKDYVTDKWIDNIIKLLRKINRISNDEPNASTNDILLSL